MKRIVAWMLMIMVAVTFVPMISFGAEQEGELTVDAITVDKETVHWFEKIELRVDYTAERELDPSYTQSFTFKSDQGTSLELSDISSSDELPHTSVKSSYDKNTSKGTYILSVYIYPKEQPCGTYHLNSFAYYYNGERHFESLKGQDISFSILPLYDSVAYCGTNEDGNLPEQLSALNEGDVASVFVYGQIFTGDDGEDYYAEVLNKEYLNAIKGRDVTLVLPLSNYSYCEVNGLDIIGETKDIQLGSGLSLEGGGMDEDGNSWCAVHFTFPDNGQLPGMVRYYFRYQDIYRMVKRGIDSRIITAEDVLTDMKLYYVSAGMLVLEEDALMKEQDWLVLELDHNSSFLASKFSPNIMRSFDASLSKKSFVYNGSVQRPTVYALEGCSVKYSNAGSKNAGQYTITVGAPPDGFGKQTLRYTILKAGNPVSVKPLTATVKYSKLKKRNQNLLRAKVLTLKKNKGTVTYVKVSGNKKISIEKTTGKVTIKKRLKKGKYKVKVKITAAGNVNYKAKTLVKTFTVRVK